MKLQDYRTITIEEMIGTLYNLSKKFKKGMKTPIYSGDFEGNYLHGKHQIMIDTENQAVFLGYEMHESIEEF